MIKKVKFLLFISIALVFVLLAVSCGGENTVTYEYELNENGEAIITSIRTLHGKFMPCGQANIPAEIDGYPVVEIGEGALQYAWINEITIPKSVKRINDFAFAEPSFDIEEIHIPASVEYIGEGVFRDFGDDCKITVDSESTYYKIVDGNLYSYNMDTLVKWNDYSNPLVTIPEGVKLIYGYAFENEEKSIVTAHLPDSLIEIADYGFYNSGITYVELPENLKSIGMSAFGVTYGEANMVELKLNRGLEEISANVINNLQSVMLHPENKHFKIVDGVLFSADGEVLHAVLKAGDNSDSYTVPDGVKTISSFAFSKADSFAIVNMPDSVTDIEEMAFQGCKSIVSINIPQNVTSIEPYTFSGCTALKTFTFSGCVDVIGENAFASCNSLENVTVPDGVKTIGEGAFYYCNSLKSITVTEGVETLGKGAFSYCKALERVYIPSTVEISEYSDIPEIFNYCLSLESIEVAEDNKTVKSVDGVLYSEDGKLLLLYPASRKSSEYTVPDGTEIICDSAFKYCDTVEEVNLPETLLIIDKEAFYDCDGIDELVIPDSVTEIREYAFSYIKFRKIVIGRGVRLIEAHAFGRWSSYRIKGLEFADPSGWKVSHNGKEKNLNEKLLSVKFFAGRYLGKKYNYYTWEKID